jgi:hypothetical protein
MSGGQRCVGHVDLVLQEDHQIVVGHRHAAAPESHRGLGDGRRGFAEVHDEMTTSSPLMPTRSRRTRSWDPMVPRACWLSVDTRVQSRDPHLRSSLIMSMSMAVGATAPAWPVSSSNANASASASSLVGFQNSATGADLRLKRHARTR